MEHLNRGAHLPPESLARLVDEAPTSDERAHLNRCRRCRDELDALQVQTLGLSHLPDLRPPRGDWEALEPRLRAEGLIRSAGPGHSGEARQGDAGASGRPRSSGGAWWSAGAGQAAAALLLVLAGAAGGAGVALAGGSGAPGTEGPASRAEAPLTLTSGLGASELDAVPAALGLTGRGGPASMEEAEAVVRLTETWYRSALLRYREAAGMEAEPSAPLRELDPRSRVAALESLLTAGRAALREAPTDPFLNGLLANMQTERDMTLQGLRNASLTHEDGWY